MLCADIPLTASVAGGYVWASWGRETLDMGSEIAGGTGTSHRRQ